MSTLIMHKKQVDGNTLSVTFTESKSEASILLIKVRVVERALEILRFENKLINYF